MPEKRLCLEKVRSRAKALLNRPPPAKFSLLVRTKRSDGLVFLSRSQTPARAPANL